MKKSYVVISVVVVAVAAGLLAVQLRQAAAPQQVACTMEARLCPDGSAVGRSGPACEFAACPTADSWPMYYSGKPGFTVRHPSSFTVNDRYVYSAMGPGREISGVSFTIATPMAIGTNLSDDTYISVETLASNATCTAAAFLDSIQSTSTATENGLTYEVAHGGGAGAGNFYDETVYVAPGPTCVAFRYLIHSTNIGNYEPGAVREFDRAALVSLFDQMRQSYNRVP